MPRPNLTTSIATRLVDLMRRSGLEEGAHITEQWAADALEVSRTPVRKAMAFLTEVGILERIPNRGFFLTRPASTLARPDLSEGEDVEQSAYFEIADDYVGGRFTGSFTSADISRHYRLTPRQADRVLSRMEGEDLVRRRAGGRGWEFQHVMATAEAHDQSYRFRMIIEPAALLEPGFTVDADAFARHRQQQQALLRGDILLLPRAELFQVNASFHEMLVGCSGNQFLLDAVRRQNRLRRLIEYRHQLDRSRLAGQAREHLRLLDLVESGDLTEASAFLSAHLDKVRSIKTGIAGEA
ncbi:MULTISPECIES: GntR family transcriptional regulator [unclassified Streptomyces]|uniref:GntR family transcriptional regulator n=1 Tax=unclassified Streptomyces TaxID=2593676 RepID=UPI002365FAE9|nr:MULTISPECIES: GntR family transcriptional regulator [unclassified Streptomyces]MDF3143208.1 GntR family transcriptional regulator [Streptomyces sp. T21Q-yed]WDF36360.1 GntR family transcriptional regulator [Streptomyces sp. T12]